MTKVKIIYIKHRNFSPKKKILIFLGGGKKPKKTIGFLKKKTTWFKPQLKSLGLNHANPDFKYVTSKKEKI